MIHCLVAAVFAVQAPVVSPLHLLEREWQSVEIAVGPDGKSVTLKLEGSNRWVFPEKLLEIRETYRVDDNPTPNFNHILMRTAGTNKVFAWWHTPDAARPLEFEGTYEAQGMTLDSRDGRLRLVYIWSGKDAYDAKLQIRTSPEAEFKDRTVARYTRRTR